MFENAEFRKNELTIILDTSGDFMIRIGPAGIPLSSRAKTLADGLRDVKKVGLNAMELQLLHGNIYIDNPDMFV